MEELYCLKSKDRDKKRRRSDTAARRKSVVVGGVHVVEPFMLDRRTSLAVMVSVTGRLGSRGSIYWDIYICSNRS